MTFFIVSTCIELSAVVLQYHRKSPFSGWGTDNKEEEGIESNQIESNRNREVL